MTEKALDLDAIEKRLDYGNRDPWDLLEEVRRLRERLQGRKVFVLLFEEAPLPEGLGSTQVEGAFSSLELLHQFAARRLVELGARRDIQPVDALTWDANGVAQIDRRPFGDHPTFEIEEHVLDGPLTLERPADPA